LEVLVPRSRALAAGLFAAALVVVPACTDEDGDGAGTDEEIGDVGDTVEDVGNEIEEEVDQGDEELEEEGDG